MLAIYNIKYIIYLLYFRKHKDDKVDDEDDNEKEKNDQEVPKWDSEFLKVDQGTLFGTARDHFFDKNLLTGQGISLNGKVPFEILPEKRHIT